MAERLFHPGTIMVLLGALLVYSSAWISGKVLKGKERGSDIVKGAGCLVAVIGTVWLFTTT